MWFNGSLGGNPKRRSSSAGLQNLNLQEWQELMQRKWIEFPGDNFEYELSKLFSEFVYNKKSKREIVKWLESIPNAYYEQTKSSPIHFVTKQDTYDVLKNFLSDGYYDINSKNGEGRTALTIAILNHNKRIAKLLIKCGATLEHEYYNGHYGPLHHAAEVANFEIVKMLIESRADINALDKNLNSPLHVLLKYNNLSEAHVNGTGANFLVQSIAAMLVKAGANVKLTNTCGENPLLVAMSACLFDVAADLVKAGACVQVADKHLTTPLHLAVQKSKCDWIASLIEHHRVDMDAIDINGLSPLCYAIRTHNYTVTEMLVNYGARTDVLHSCSFDAIFEAVKSKNIKLLSLLIKVEPQLKTTNDFKCLQIATTYGRVDILEKLVEIGVDVTAKDSRGYGLIFNTCTTSKSEAMNWGEKILKFLLSKGAGVNLRPVEIKNAMYLLVRFADVETVRTFSESHIEDFLEYDALRLLKYATENKENKGVFKFIAGKLKSVIDKLEYCSYYGDTAALVHRLAKNTNYSALKYLLKMGVDVDTVTKTNNYTPLHIAVQYKNAESVRLLLLYDSDIDKKDSYGKSAVRMAMENHKLDCVCHIVRHIAILDLMEKPFSQDYYNLIHSTAEVQNFYNKCMEELSSMQQHQLCDGTNLLQVVVDSKSYRRNSLVIEAMKDMLPFDAYKLYHDVLKKRLRDIQVGLLTDDTGSSAAVLLESNYNDT